MKNGGNGEVREGDYRAARVGAAAALTGVLVFVLIADVLDSDYDPSPWVLIVLAALITSLLAVDLPDLLKRGGP